jgi:hypothetical protein
MQTSMPLVGFESTTVFERAKTVHAIGRAATVIGEVKQGLFIIISIGQTDIFKP